MGVWYRVSYEPCAAPARGGRLCRSTVRHSSDLLLLLLLASGRPIRWSSQQASARRQASVCTGLVRTGGRCRVAGGAPGSGAAAAAERVVALIPYIRALIVAAACQNLPGLPVSTVSVTLHRGQRHGRSIRCC